MSGFLTSDEGRYEDVSKKHNHLARHSLVPEMNFHSLIHKTSRNREAFWSANREEFKLLISIGQPLRPALVIATLLQHRTDSNQKEHP